MSEITLIVRAPDRIHKCEVTVSIDQKVDELKDGAIRVFSLPVGYNYEMFNFTSGKTLNENQTLRGAGVNNHDTLDLLPMCLA